MYKLKRNVADFIVVDGYYEGKSFLAGQVYVNIPAHESHKFEKLEEEEVKPKKGGKKE